MQFWNWNSKAKTRPKTVERSHFAVFHFFDHIFQFLILAYNFTSFCKFNLFNLQLIAFNLNFEKCLPPPSLLKNITGTNQLALSRTSRASRIKWPTRWTRIQSTRPSR
jgi:hypothetical protein